MFPQTQTQHDDNYTEYTGTDLATILTEGFDLEQQLIRPTMQKARPNSSEAAPLLGISRAKLNYRFKKYNFS